MASYPSGRALVFRFFRFDHCLFSRASHDAAFFADAFFIGLMGLRDALQVGCHVNPFTSGATSKMIIFFLRRFLAFPTPEGNTRFQFFISNKLIVALRTTMFEMRNLWNRFS